jgi:hypothetical protein
MDRAIKRAIEWRDSKLVRSLHTNTGYDNIKLEERDDKLTLVIKPVSTTKQFELFVDLDNSRLFKDIFDEALTLMCRRYRLLFPLEVVYDYALNTAYNMGYDGHEDDPKNVSPKYEVGNAITIHPSGETGVIKAIAGEGNYWVEFESGERLRTVVNHSLLANSMEANLDKIEELEKVKTEEMTESEVERHEAIIETLKENNSIKVKCSNKNKDISDNSDVLRNLIKRNKKRTNIRYTSHKSNEKSNAY